MTSMRATAVISAVVLLTASVVGCTREIAGVAAVSSEVTEGAPNACTAVSPPLMPVPAEADDEPRILIPQPSGWERTSDADSELVRFAMTDASRTGDHLAFAVVGLQSKVGYHEPATIFEDLRWDAEKDPGITDLKLTGGTVCGYPALTANYTKLATDELPTRKETMQTVVVHTTNRTHAATVSISTNDANNPAYQRDLATILPGFRVLAPFE